jgi:hypothetical protein
MKKLLVVFFTILSVQTALCQRLTPQFTNAKASFRGLSVVNENTAWVSGSNGTVGKTTNGGKTWEFFTVKGYEKIDFRDIEAFDGATAVIMGVGAPAYILKTFDGGVNWRLVYQNADTTMFLDAMEFWNEQSGIIIGDPINGSMFVLRSFDGGDTWREIPFDFRPKVIKGEACFASSGTNIVKINNKEAVFVTGGTSSNLYLRNKIINIPIQQGTESTGANSIAAKNDKKFIIVGGDFNHKDSALNNCAITNNAGKTFIKPQQGPTGYRSCVIYIKNKTWLTCGLNGVDISNDDGLTWQNITKTGYHVCKKAKKENTVYLAGANGRIARFEVE